MRKWRICICVLLVLAMIPALLWVRNILPVKEKKYIEKKYSGWNGVLRAWFCCEWECASGFTGWLNRCAAAFEKQNKGVYIEIEPVTSETVRSLAGSGLNLPDLLLFSTGLTDSPDGMVPLDCPVHLRSALSSVGGGYALPVAMGGYIIAESEEDFAAISVPPDGIHNYSAALIALSEEAPPDTDVPETGIDLGLPASAAQRTFVLNRKDSALDDFIGGSTPAVLIDQKGLARLIALREAGRGPEWSLLESGRYAFTDQLLMCAVIRSERSDAVSRIEYAKAFAQSLLAEENQRSLASTGAYSVLNERIYADTSAYAPLERLLVSRTLIVPACFHARQPDFSLPAERLAAGDVTAEEAGAALASAYSATPDHGRMK